MKNTLRYKDYLATVEFSQDDEVFHGKIFGINDLVTFEGESVKELKTAFHDAVDDYLETCRQLEKTPEKTFKGVFNVRVPSALHKTAAYVALQNNVTLNDFVRAAIQYAVQHEDEVSKELFLHD